MFEKINKTDKPLGKLIKKKRKRTQISQIGNEKGEVTTDSTEIPRIINYSERLYTSKLGNLEEMDDFLERYSLPRMNKGENMNRPITSTDIETGIKNLPTNKSLGPDGFKGES